jgi:hypothetical protein
MLSGLAGSLSNTQMESVAAACVVWAAFSCSGVFLGFHSSAVVLPQPEARGEEVGQQAGSGQAGDACGYPLATEPSSTTVHSVFRLQKGVACACKHTHGVCYVWGQLRHA